jgi:hypothetical protein
MCSQQLRSSLLTLIAAAQAATAVLHVDLPRAAQLQQHQQH